MPARSVAVTFQNQTDSALILTDEGLDHGIWTTQPPSRIEPDQVVQFASESSGIATGTEGHATYQLEFLAATVTLHWDNPFIGSNSYSESVSDPIWHRVNQSGSGDGDNSSITYTLQETSSQRDGIPDDWKINGANVDDGSGNTVHVDLPAMGASTSQPDVFVQIDWMQDSTHNYALSAAALKTVVDAFKYAPYVSPTGATGINLHIDAGPDSIMNYTTGQKWGSLSKAKAISVVTNFGTADASNNYKWDAFDGVKNDAGGFTSTGRTGIFHYCLSINQFATFPNSGIARGAAQGPGGNDFIVSLGPISATPSDMNMAGTFMHELGHNLGLSHGGQDGTNWKPNYVSIMNYLFQLNGLSKNGVTGICNYSDIVLPSLDESGLDEPTGLGPDAAGISTFRWSAGANAYIAIADGSKAIDWNDDGTFESTYTAFDVNGDGSIGGSASPLVGCDDWKILKLKSAAIGGGSGAPGGESVSVSQVDEMTKYDLDLIQPPDHTPPVTTATLSPPPNAAGWNNTSVNVTLNATDDLSGVASTSYQVDGSTNFTTTSPNPTFTVSGEGIHVVNFYSTDRGQNNESIKSITIKIDLTSPEAIITYDSADHKILVDGSDALSGYFGGIVSPTSVIPSIWRAPGADVSETRTYRLNDLAGNWTEVVMQVRSMENEYELNIISITSNTGDEDLKFRNASVYLGRLQKNTIQFRRVMPGKCCDTTSGTISSNSCCCSRSSGKCVLAVLQRLVLAAPTESVEQRVMLQAQWDILHDESNITISTLTDGDASSSGNSNGHGCECGKKKGEDPGRKGDEPVRCARVCGLWQLKIVAANGRLAVSTSALDDAFGVKNANSEVKRFMM